MLEHNSTENHTDSLYTAHWSGTSIVSLTNSILTFMLNGLVLYTFARERQLWSSFNVYVINLLLANFIYSIGNTPTDLFHDLFEVYWLSSAWCTVDLYFQWTISNIQIYAHPLIAINRMWATVFPIHYRHHHNTRLAVSLCICCFIFAHALSLPGLILDAVFYRLPELIEGCQLNLNYPGQKAWSCVVQFINIVLELIVLVQYPFILRKYNQRRKIQGKKLMNQLLIADQTLVRIEPDSCSDAAKVSRQPNAIRTVTVDGNRAASGQQRLKRPQPKTILVLSLVTLSIFIFWTPSLVYYALLPFTDVYDEFIFNTVMMIFETQQVVDPILFTISRKELRDAVKRQVFCMS